jgi:hypothetical protein
MGIRRKSVEERVAEPSGERLQDGCEPRTAIEETELVDEAWVLKSAAGVFRDAMEAKDYAAAVRAVEIIAQVTGCLNEPPGENAERQKQPPH